MLFEYEVGSDSTHAVITHFWAAGSGGIDSTLIKCYIDGESEPSIEFTPSTAAGVGFGQQDVFVTKWIGKGAADTGWFTNIQVPFSSIRVTFQQSASASDDDTCMGWFIVRGTESLPIKIGALELPTHTRLQTQHQPPRSPADPMDLLARWSGSPPRRMSWRQHQNTQPQPEPGKPARSRDSNGGHFRHARIWAGDV